MSQLVIDDDKDTKIAIEAYYAPEGQVAAWGDDAKVRLDDLVAEAKKIAAKVREGLKDLGPNEVALELGFSAGKNVWVISAQGSIKLTMKWTLK